METLKKYDLERRCFRSVGGVLVERKVKDVLPALQINTEQVGVFSVVNDAHRFCRRYIYFKWHVMYSL